MVSFDNKMHAIVVESPYDPDGMAVSAARVSFNQDVPVIGWPEADRKGLIKFLVKNGHWSPFEHSSWTFVVEVPIFIARQLMRHKSMSFNEISGRYSEMPMKFYAPPTGRPLVQTGKAGAYKFKQGNQDQEDILRASILAHSVDCSKKYYELLELGICKELARVVLPSNLYTRLYMTGNTRSLLHFMQSRLDEQAQHEIRELAQLMAGVVELEAPHTYAAFMEAKDG